MAALVAEHLDHQVGGAVHDFRAVQKIRRGIDEAAEPDHPHLVVEIADGGLDLNQQVDRTSPRRRLALLDADARAELAPCYQLPVGIVADLAGDGEDIAGPHERYVIGDRGEGRMKRDSETREFPFDFSCHRNLRNLSVFDASYAQVAA